MLYVIDRFESKWAVIGHNQETFNIPKELLPNDAKEGDIITIDVTVDKITTKNAQEEVKKLFESLLEEE